MTSNLTTSRTLLEWVEYVQTLHYREIELSLERVRTVYQRLCPDGFKPKIISIAGTNGKGSCAELISSIYLNAGFKVGKFTSPHLVNFSERFVINGQQVSDAALLGAFERVELARGDIGITFFEFGTLLAIELFSLAQVDMAVMEVGLGGRLDAVNILDADVAIITSISRDHTAWLGDTLEEIAFEKAGIARQGAPCVIGIDEPQHSILRHCEKIGAPVFHLKRDFNYYQADPTSQIWSWQSDDRSFESLPLPFAQTGVQLSNAAVCIQAITLLSDSLPISETGLRAGLQAAQVFARCQILSRQPQIVLDVAHNQKSVMQLRNFIGTRHRNGRLIAVCGMLKDKEVQQSLATLSDMVDVWYFATIAHERGASAEYLQIQLDTRIAGQSDLSNDDHRVNGDVYCFENVKDAFMAACAQATTDDCLVVFGSFFVAGDILRVVRGRTSKASANIANTI